MTENPYLKVVNTRLVALVQKLETTGLSAHEWGEFYEMVNYRLLFNNLRTVNSKSDDALGRLRH